MLALLQRLNEQQLWDSAQANATLAGKRDGLERLRVAFPDGVYAEKAKAELDKLNEDQPQVAVVTPAPPVPTGDDRALPPPQRGFSYVTGLDASSAYGWLALRYHPDYNSKWSDTHMGPGTLLTVLGRDGDWANVRLQNGETGWANARYIACCVADPDQVAAPRPVVSQPTPVVSNAGGLYYVIPMDGSSLGWLALRHAPSPKSPWSNTHLFPGTLMNVIGRNDVWMHVRLASGETGWVNGNYVACCRTAP